MMYYDVNGIICDYFYLCFSLIFDYYLWLLVALPQTTTSALSLGPAVGLPFPKLPSP